MEGRTAETDQGTEARPIGGAIVGDGTSTRMAQIGDSSIDVFSPDWDGPQPGTVVGGPFPNAGPNSGVEGVEGGNGQYVNLNIQKDYSRFPSTQPAPWPTLVRVPLYDIGHTTDGDGKPWARWRS